MALREEPLAYIETWQRGAEGERKTAAVLAPLERSGLKVVHDVQCRRGNYDHIAVGRSGVLLLETKNPQGIIELRGGVPHLRRRDDPDADTPLTDVRPRALGAAAQLKRDLEEQTGTRTWIQAVVVFWSEFPEGVVDDGRCVFIHGAQLAGWVQGRPSRLNQGDLAAIAAALTNMARRTDIDESLDRGAPLRSGAGRPTLRSRHAGQGHAESG